MATQRLSTALGTLASISLLMGGMTTALAQKGANPFDALKEGSVVQGFRTSALYLNDADQPTGGRFIHERTGFVLDLLQIQSVPQGFIWVKSFPTSDMGEPHTQEHLLLGKGNNGRYVATLEGMSLSESSAFTQQWRTCYHFNTGAGSEVYYEQFERRIDALLHPDYTDEEIRREVCNFGVTENPGDGKLRLEEKGTVYNEMVSTFERPWTRLMRQLDLAIYGNNHPLSYVSGGLPAAIREMQPEHIRTFHRDNYRLDNMGMVGSFPKEMPLEDILRRTSEILNRQQPDVNPPANLMTEEKLPAPKPAAPGSIIYSEFPSNNDQQPGPLAFGWPATLNPSLKEMITLDLFLQNLAGDESSNLYKRFIDTKTREIDLGAQGVFAWLSTDKGFPIFIGVDELPTTHMNEGKIKEIRGKIIDEIKRIASWKDGSKELAEFNARMKNRIIGERRSLAKSVNTPPGFGFRGTGSGWLDQLTFLEKSPGFRKSLLMKNELGAIEAELNSGKNVWRDYVAKWHLADVVPVAGVAVPKPDLIKKEAAERNARIAAETARLKEVYKATGDQEAIALYKADYDSMSAVLDRLAAGVKQPKFIDAPPMTLDDQLDYKVTTLPGNVQMVASTFDNMTSATTGLALRLNSVPETEYVYLSILPTLLTNVGLYENGKALSYDEMSQRQREEILGISAYFSTNFRTGRSEIVLRGAGNDAAEAEKSINWMKRVLLYPDWRPENLARIRDVVDQTLSGLRGTMQQREEAWVHNPAGAYRVQENRLMLSTESFLTRAHNAHRLRWMLKDAGADADRNAISAYLTRLADAGSMGKRDELRALLAAMKGEKGAQVSATLNPFVAEFEKLPAGARANALEAAKDLDQMLNDIPDDALAKDWRYLAMQMRRDLLVSPEQALNDLNNLRRRILMAGNARMFMIGARNTQERLNGPVRDLIATLDPSPVHTVPPSSVPLVKTRLRERMPDATKPVFVGLVNPNTGSGVFINSAPLTSYRDTTREALLMFLASKLFSGHGSHGLFMKTWGAGLAYSNGASSSPGSGRMNYYAERCPELPQTLRFVIEQVKNAPRDPKLADYCVSLPFQEYRSASSYESRGESMAADLADGVTPEVVRNFRKSLLELRNTQGLIDLLYDRAPAAYARVFPGFTQNAQEIPGSIYFTIGPEKQHALYEKYLQTAVSPDAKVYRLYPRDFWIPLEDEELGMQEN